MKIVIEGNIGCGKSSLITSIGKNMRIPIFLEPLSEWNLLSAYYKNPEKYALGFNIEVLLSFYKWKDNNFNAIYERSPTSCKYVFTELSHSLKNISNGEMELFNKLYNVLAWKNDIVIYLKTDDDSCYKRMQHRDRKCEQSVEFDYIKQVNQKHENLINHYKLHNIPVYTINGNQEPEKVYEDVKNIILKHVKSED